MIQTAAEQCKQRRLRGANASLNDTRRVVGVAGKYTESARTRSSSAACKQAKRESSENREREGDIL